MATIEEKRVYAGGERTTLYLACGLGVASVSVSDDLIGEFGVEARGEARDVAGREGLLAAATEADALVGADLERTGFGPARAVGTDGETAVAADSEGVARYDGEWRRIADRDVKRFDRALAAGADVYRVDDGLEALDCPAEPNDVSLGEGTAFAATDDGPYRLESGGWKRELAGACLRVAAGGDFAVGPDAGDFWGRAGNRWERVDLPVSGRVADAVRTDEGTYAVTQSGTVLANAGDGWRSRETGLRGVCALAAP
jgi:hypothetical protein